MPTQPQHFAQGVQTDDNVLAVSPSEEFVLTEEVRAITDRALCYLDAGYAVHLSGPAGTGKTTLAFHIAAQLGNPITLMHGNDEFAASDLVGKDSGYRKSTVIDNFVSSVLKTEERFDVNWTQNRLTTACELGHTLIYDEFNRTRPEANNILLSILEEGILSVSGNSRGPAYMDVAPTFRAILTSNPEEYAGVHRTQDALLDRLVTIAVDHYDAQTEHQITAAKSGLGLEQASRIVELARLLREIGPSPCRPTIRACIAIARVCAAQEASIWAEDDFFRAVCHDVFLGIDARRQSHEHGAVTPGQLDDLIDAVCAAPVSDR